jgi:hypothetical protein
MRAQNIPVQSRIAIQVDHASKYEMVHLTAQSLRDAGFADVSFKNEH